MSRFFIRIAISIAALLVMVVAACIATGYFAYALDLFLVKHMSPAAAAVLTLRGNPGAAFGWSLATVAITLAWLFYHATSRLDITL